MRCLCTAVLLPDAPSASPVENHIEFTWYLCGSGVSIDANNTLSDVCFSAAAAAGQVELDSKPPRVELVRDADFDLYLVAPVP